MSGRDLILFFGGLFLLWKSSQEMYHALEGEDETGETPTGKGGSFIYTIVQIAIIDIVRSEEHTSELQSLMRISYAVFCLKKKKKKTNINTRKCDNHQEHKDDRLNE